MKIQITIEDRDSGVRVTFNPPIEPLKEKIRLKIDLAPVEFYAAAIASSILSISDKLNSYDEKRIITPGEL